MKQSGVFGRSGTIPFTCITSSIIVTCRSCPCRTVIRCIRHECQLPPILPKDGLEVQLRYTVVHAFQPCEGVWEVHAQDLANGSAKTFRYALL